MINSDYMNRIEMQGVAEKIDHKIFSNGKEKTSFFIVITKNYEGKSYTNKFSCVYWGETHIKENDFIRIIGELKNESWDAPEGGKKWKTVVQVKQAFSIFPVTISTERIEQEENTTNGVLVPMAQTLTSHHEENSIPDDEPIF